MLNRLLRVAAFQNPEFYKAQAMRLPTYAKPRVIACGQDFPKAHCLATWMLVGGIGAFACAPHSA